jgi:hypothetical protein
VVPAAAQETAPAEETVPAEEVAAVEAQPQPQTQQVVPTYNYYNNRGRGLFRRRR